MKLNEAAIKQQISFAQQMKEVLEGRDQENERVQRGIAYCAGCIIACQEVLAALEEKKPAPEEVKKEEKPKRSRKKAESQEQVAETVDTDIDDLF